MAWFDQFARNLGSANAPFGFAPVGSPSQGPVDPAYTAGMSMLGDVGMRMLASGSRNPAQAFGQAYIGAKDNARQQNKEAFAAQQLMEQAEENRKKREEEAKRQRWIDEQISQLPADQQALARMMPDKFFGNQIDSMFSSPDLTDDMKEYNWAVQNGYQGTPMEYMAEIKRAGANNITIEGNKYGTIPPGFQLMETQEGVSMQPIPGSPAAMEAEQAARARENKSKAQTTTGDMMVEDIDRTLATVQNSTLPTTGLAGNMLKGIGGTGAGDVNKLLTGIKANIGFDRLQRMRDESPTGGALGQVAIQELESLQSVYGSLEQSQSRGQFEYNLKRLKNMYLDIVHGPGNGPPRERLDTGRKSQKTSSGVEWSIVE